MVLGSLSLEKTGISEILCHLTTYKNDLNQRGLYWQHGVLTKGNKRARLKSAINPKFIARSSNTLS